LQIVEECGYDVPLAGIVKVASYLSAIGISGSRHTIFAAQLDESMRVNDGGGLTWGLGFRVVA
jgi:UDP-sugar diphosphatase